MRNTFLFFCFLFSISAQAVTVGQSFQDFYYNFELSPNKCGVNIQKFLVHLNQRNVKFNKGFVVSIHEDFAELNHFDARWGPVETYTNGVPYRRNNWYFHVFAVIDSIVYDFSQTGPKAQPLAEYLQTAYIPSFETNSIGMMGILTPATEMKRYINLKMSLYDIDEFRKPGARPQYQGVFIELFNL